MKFSLDDSRLIVWLDGPPAEGFARELDGLISENEWEQVKTVILDLGEVDQLSSSHLGEFALLKSDKLLEEKDLEFRNLRQSLFNLFSTVGLDQMAKVEVAVEAEREETGVIGGVPGCPLSGEDICEQCDNVKQLLAELEERKNELEKMRGELVHSDKVGTLGQMAAGVAHEFNNMLSIMSGYAQLALIANDLPEAARNALEIIEESCVRAAAVTEALLNFSRRKTPLKKKIDISDLIKQQLRLLSSEFLAHSVETKLYLCEQTETMADPSQIDQVFLNLFTNAIHAMPDGGELTISSTATEHDIIVTVADTGLGIDKRTLGKIFAPFFTTKGAFGGGAAKGTGLGLSVSHGIIANHGGTISVVSTPGKGTTFTISMPIKSVEEEAPAPTDPVALSPVEGSTTKVLTILVADDEAHMRKLMQKQLSSMGHTVLLAADGLEAVQLCKESCPDLIFLDMLMPKMNGADALLAIRRIHPDIGIAVITGQAGKALEAMLEMMRRSGNIELIRKPFKLTDIKAFVQSHIDSL